MFAIPVTIGEEIPRPSTWFHGYNGKFFYDRGEQYQKLNGKLAPVMGARFLYKNRKTMCEQFPVAKAKQLMKAGYRLNPMPEE